MKYLSLEQYFGLSLALALLPIICGKIISELRADLGLCSSTHSPSLILQVRVSEIHSLLLLSIAQIL